jgi:hypothetical protein
MLQLKQATATYFQILSLSSLTPFSAILNISRTGATLNLLINSWATRLILLKHHGSSLKYVTYYPKQLVILFNSFP